MDRCHNAARVFHSLIEESVTLLWSYSPYNDNRHGDEKRLELAFQKPTTHNLVRGRELVFVIL